MAVGGHALSPTRRWGYFLSVIFLYAWPVAGAFEVQGAGAFSASMGHALSTSVQSAESVWYNPATAARIGTARVTATQALLWTGVGQSPTVHSLAGIWPQTWGTIALGYTGFRADGWNERGFLLGWSRGLSDRWAVGGLVKANNWDAGRLSRGHWVSNVGILYEAGWVTRKTYLRISGVANNLGLSRKEDGRLTGQRPRSFTAGVQVVAKQQLFALDCVREERGWEMRGGYQSELRAGLKLRIGTTVHIEDTLNRTGHVGLGYEWKNIGFDYAFSHSYDLVGFGADHRFGVGYIW